MLPTLMGRIQSRIFFLATIGSFWTFIMASILPAKGAPWTARLHDGFAALLWVAIFGVVWELIYHLLMQWRWEKDWPTFFGLITLLNEGLLVYFLGDYGYLPLFIGHGYHGGGLLPFWFFWPLFVVVWLAIWVWTNGPMRVFNIHWRFFGGRLV